MKRGLRAERGSCLDPSGALELSWTGSQGQYVKSHEELVQHHHLIYHKLQSTNSDHHSVLYFITVGAITEGGGRFCPFFTSTKEIRFLLFGFFMSMYSLKRKRK